MKTRTLLQIAFIIGLSQSNISTAQCVAGGFANGTTSSNDPIMGTWSWATPGNSLLSDGLFAQAGTFLGVLSSAQTQMLSSKNFGFAIPATAVICGIEVEVNKSTDGIIVLGGINDNTVRLYKAGVLTGANRAVGGNWPSAPTYFTYGGPADLWGTTWLPADINNSTFGMGISANLFTGLASLFIGSNVDHVRIQVYFDDILPVELSSFKGETVKRCAEITWTTESETNNDYFTVQKRVNGQFENMITIPSQQGSTTEQSNYVITDCSMDENNYYRLMQTDLDGTSDIISDVILVQRGDYETTLSLFPNPAKGLVSISSEEIIISTEIYSQNGVLISQNKPSDGSKTVNLELTGIQKGMYLVHVYSATGKTTERLVVE